MERKCPRCRLPMSAIEVGETRLLECARCGGVWADKLSLEQICNDRERHAAVLGMPGNAGHTGSRKVEQNVRYLPCPVCKKLMNRVNFARCSHVIVDVCRTDGTWFDKDELRKIVEFIRAGGLEQARARQMADLEEQKRSAKAAQTAAGWDRAYTPPESATSLLRVLLGRLD